jgi:transcription elongation factor GreA
MQKHPITTIGFARLQAELKNLRLNERPAIIVAISTARDHGDLKENAEYHSAKEKQGFIEGRISELEGIEAFAEIIDLATIKSKRIVFGATVGLLDTDTDKEITYQIVGDYESDIANGRVSYNSPIAKGLIGKEVGDDAEVHTPKGKKTYEVLSIKF